MALTVTHTFVSSKADGPDATKLRPSNWGSVNTVGDTHVVSGSPGSDTQVVFNDTGSLAADAGFTYNKATDLLTLLVPSGAGSTPALRLQGARPSIDWYTTGGVLMGQIDTLDDVPTNKGLEFRSPIATLGASGWHLFRFNGGNNKVYIGDTGSVSWIVGGHDLAFKANRGSSPDTAGFPDVTISSQILSVLSGTYGAQINIRQQDDAGPPLSGASVLIGNFIPAGSLMLGVTVRVTATVTGATSFQVGDGTDTDRWGAAIGVALGTTSSMANFTIPSPVYYAAATNVVFTANGSNFTGGTIHSTVHYISLTAPTV